MDNDNFSNTLGLASFILGIMNLQENLTQNDKQELLDKFNNESQLLLNEIHSHLQRQDDKIDEILLILKNQNKD